MLVAQRRAEPDAFEPAPAAGTDPERSALALLAADAPSHLDPHWLGAAYQRALDDREGSRVRRTAGVFYTPPDLVRHVLARTIDPLLAPDAPLPRVLDPACGCGAFLVEAARRMRESRPHAPPRDIASSLQGIDIDPLAVSLCRLALWIELCTPDEPLHAVHDCVSVADSLLEPPPGAPFDAVIGNPPFLSQLSSVTARQRHTAAALRERFGDAVRAYTDPAALFLHAAIESVRDGGRVGMILPVSVLASRDAAAVRARVADLGAIRSLWLDTDGVFDAGVRTIALTLERAGATHPIDRSCGRDFHPCPPCDPDYACAATWGPLAADLAGIPSITIDSARQLAEIAEITAGFRDEYYAVVAAIRELRADGPPGPLPVISVGMIDPFAVRWGDGPVRIGGRLWQRPAVLPHSTDTKLAALLRQQRRPKFLVATQSRAIEVAADPTGSCVALTPTVMAFPREAHDFWRVGAALASPVVAAWAAAQSFGTARSLTAIKPSAALLRAAPMPPDSSDWERAAALLQTRCTAPSDLDPAEAEVGAFGLACCDAYALRAADADRLMTWWLPRVCSSRPRRTLDGQTTEA